MELVRDLITILFIVLGLFFFTVATVGLIRLPDVYTRLHATTKGDTLGAALVLLGLSLYGGLEINTVKLGMIIAFVWLTNPTASHLVGKAAYRTDVSPHSGEFQVVDYRDESEDKGV